MSEEFNLRADAMFDFVNTYNTHITIFAIVIFMGYAYMRKQTNMMIYLLDFIMLCSVLLTLYIILFPHRYWGIIHFMILTFR